MSALTSLKNAKTLQELALLLGFKPAALAYVLYKKPKEQLYYEFEIDKRNGGKRKICAPCPELKELQSRLSELLQDCLADIKKTNNVNSSLSHGFMRKHSIVTNAAVHRRRRFVFNIDLENFFGTINFGRVRGFFIGNRDFSLDPKVATIVAQIACYNNELPQGSPCSPIISNLVGNILDIRLAKLAYAAGCSYSRYADDITFSTNKPIFPAKIAKQNLDKGATWEPGRQLKKVIKEADFEINSDKTRMQFKMSRQEVTGLVVNKKVNIRREYVHLARSMVNCLLKKGEFYFTEEKVDEKGDLVRNETPGTLDKLHGMLSFIDAVSAYNWNVLLNEEPKKIGKEKSKSNPFSLRLPSRDRTFANFLFYKDFYAANSPVILCEGKTDNIYIRAAIRQMAGDYPDLIEKNDAGKLKTKIRLYQFTRVTARILGLSGGTGELPRFIGEYKGNCESITAEGLALPVILLIDNDDGAKKVFSSLSQITKAHIDGKASYYHAGLNLYVVPTPLTDAGNQTTIEDFFEPKILTTKLNGKAFNPSKKGFDHKTEYGKYLFAEHVISKHQDKIDFSGFKRILDPIAEVIKTHRS